MTPARKPYIKNIIICRQTTRALYFISWISVFKNIHKSNYTFVICKLRGLRGPEDRGDMFPQKLVDFQWTSQAISQKAEVFTYVNRYVLIGSF
jgi:hypothetical protein